MICNIFNITSYHARWLGAVIDLLQFIANKASYKKADQTGTEKNGSAELRC